MPQEDKNTEDYPGVGFTPFTITLSKADFTYVIIKCPNQGQLIRASRRWKGGNNGSKNNTR